MQIGSDKRREGRKERMQRLSERGEEEEEEGEAFICLLNTLREDL